MENGKWGARIGKLVRPLIVTTLLGIQPGSPPVAESVAYTPVLPASTSQQRVDLTSCSCVDGIWQGGACDGRDLLKACKIVPIVTPTPLPPFSTVDVNDIPELQKVDERVVKVDGYKLPIRLGTMANWYYNQGVNIDEETMRDARIAAIVEGTLSGVENSGDDFTLNDLIKITENLYNQDLYKREGKDTQTLQERVQSGIVVCFDLSILENLALAKIGVTSNIASYVKYMMTEYKEAHAVTFVQIGGELFAADPSNNRVVAMDQFLGQVNLHKFWLDSVTTEEIDLQRYGFDEASSADIVKDGMGQKVPISESN